MATATTNSALDFAQLRAANVERCETDFGHPLSGYLPPNTLEMWDPLQWAGATAGELGEAANLSKKLVRGDYTTIGEIAHAKAEIALELADTLTYLDLWAASLGIDLGEAVRRKFNIVSDRIGSEVRL